MGSYGNLSISELSIFASEAKGSISLISCLTPQMWTRSLTPGYPTYEHYGSTYLGFSGQQSVNSISTVDPELVYLQALSQADQYNY